MVEEAKAQIQRALETVSAIPNLGRSTVSQETERVLSDLAIFSARLNDDAEAVVKNETSELDSVTGNSGDLQAVLTGLSFILMLTLASYRKAPVQNTGGLQQQATGSLMGGSQTQGPVTVTRALPQQQGHAAHDGGDVR